MTNNNVNLEIMQFVEQQILPRYAAFGRSHGLTHVQHVISNSLELARSLGVDVNMAYVIAAYHDLGMSGPRAIHHITGGKILATDARLKKWFSPQQLQIMKEAVEDHRASTSHTPRSIYGKIVSDADRDLDPETVFTRCIEYGFEHYPELDKTQQWERFNQHMEDKYSAHGYIRLWIPGSINERRLKKVRDIIDNKQQLRQVFDRIFEQAQSQDPTSK